MAKKSKNTAPILDATMWPIDKIIPFEKNPRTHPSEQVDLLATMIETYGWDQAIVVDEDGVILKGHGRKLAALKNGYKQAPVVQRLGLTEQQKTEMRIADNSLALLSGWHPEFLKEGIVSLQAMDYNIDLLGFPEAQLRQYGIELGNVTGSDSEAVPERPTNPVVRAGDVWKLGDHALVCGDSSSTELVVKILAGRTVDLVFTDPPYRMQAEGGSKQPIGRAAARLGDSIKHLIDFNPKVFLEMLPRLFAHGRMNAYIFCNKDLVPEYLAWAVANDYAFNILFWKKPMAIPLGGQHRPDVEYLLFFRRQGIWNNAVGGATYSKCLEFGRDDSEDHPTIKPVGLVANELLISSKVGSLVAEPFSGSGTTIIAGEMTGRHVLAFEIDPGYAEVGLRRWETYTGKHAVLESTGKTFADTAKDRQRADTAAKKKTPAAKAGASPKGAPAPA